MRSQLMARISTQAIQTCELHPSPLTFLHGEDCDLVLLSPALSCPRAFLSALLHINGYNEMERETCTENVGDGNPVPLELIEIPGGSGPVRDC